MHVTEEFEDRLVNRIVEALEPKFEAIDKRLDGHDKRFDGIDVEFDAIRVEMQSESNRICEKIDNLDKRVGRLETVAQANWNVPEIMVREGESQVCANLRTGSKFIQLYSYLRHRSLLRGIEQPERDQIKRTYAYAYGVISAF